MRAERWWRLLKAKEFNINFRVSDDKIYRRFVLSSFDVGYLRKLREVKLTYQSFDAGKQNENWNKGKKIVKKRLRINFPLIRYKFHPRDKKRIYKLSQLNKRRILTSHGWFFPVFL